MSSYLPFEGAFGGLGVMDFGDGDTRWSAPTPPTPPPPSAPGPQVATTLPARVMVVVRAPLVTAAPKKRGRGRWR